MHPLLANRARLGAYLLGWLPIALLLMGIARSQGWSWVEAGTLAPPLCLLAAFLFLSAWFLCRAMPLVAVLTGPGAGPLGVSLETPLTGAQHSHPLAPYREYVLRRWSAIEH